MVSLLIGITHVRAGIIEGLVTDAETDEPLVGASVTYAEGKGISTDIDGLFSSTIPNGKHILTLRYIGYQEMTKEVTVTNSKQQIEIRLTPNNATLNNVTVLGDARHNTEFALVREQQQAHVTMISVSEQQISRMNSLWSIQRMCRQLWRGTGYPQAA